jgi:hypothetical protein
MNEDALTARYLAAVLQHAVGSHPVQDERSSLPEIQTLQKRRWTWNGKRK